MPREKIHCVVNAIFQCKIVHQLGVCGGRFQPVLNGAPFPHKEHHCHAWICWNLCWRAQFPRLYQSTWWLGTKIMTRHSINHPKKFYKFIWLDYSLWNLNFFERVYTFTEGWFTGHEFGYAAPQQDRLLNLSRVCTRASGGRFTIYILHADLCRHRTPFHYHCSFGLGCAGLKGVFMSNFPTRKNTTFDFFSRPATQWNTTGVGHPC